MKLTYRPEIDGLRAIAVFAVILYHAEISILGYKPWGGGFIGVDIFFVISGYLITSIILKELVSTGSFSFKNFYNNQTNIKSIDVNALKVILHNADKKLTPKLINLVPVGLVVIPEKLIDIGAEKRDDFPTMFAAVIDDSKS